MTFQGHRIKTVTMSNGQGFVVLRSLYEAFGINYTAQRRRAQRTTVFRDYSMLVYVLTPGGRQAQPACRRLWCRPS